MAGGHAGTRPTSTESATTWVHAVHAELPNSRQPASTAEPGSSARPPQHAAPAQQGQQGGRVQGRQLNHLPHQAQRRTPHLVGGVIEPGGAAPAPTRAAAAGACSSICITWQACSRQGAPLTTAMQGASACSSSGRRAASTASGSSPRRSAVDGLLSPGWDEKLFVFREVPGKPFASGWYRWYNEWCCGGGGCVRRGQHASQQILRHPPVHPAPHLLQQLHPPHTSASRGISTPSTAAPSASPAAAASLDPAAAAAATGGCACTARPGERSSCSDSSGSVNAPMTEQQSRTTARTSGSPIACVQAEVRVPLTPRCCSLHSSTSTSCVRSSAAARRRDSSSHDVTSSLSGGAVHSPYLYLANCVRQHLLEVLFVVRLVLHAQPLQEGHGVRLGGHDGHGGSAAGIQPAGAK
ncbi:hypothetical protein TSOC_000368 [Tetrabaena socialis]|uniref:Uncharacterized protein n=1 Tax=Tetrabaena socialis TaxID=47790 RepID=A0A2J8AJM3_9CHLO|nr:hypothetical protein TSOC_000368 [Tetrabaena socialis]|eukprot:PNH12710.1 hypothetical protein TSOC_000368 [Tetrabaena socialis]